MKNIIFLLLVLIITGCKAETNTKKINDTLHSFYEAIESNDYQILRYITSDDYKMITPGNTLTTDSLINNLKGPNLNGKINHTLSDIQITLEGSAAWITYRNDKNIVTDNYKSHEQWSETAVLKKAGDNWKVALIHSTANGSGSTSTAKRALIGGWEVAYGTYGIEDDPVEVNPPDGPNSLKVFSKEHFAYVLTDKDGSFLGAAAGRYEIHEDRYTETVQWSSTPGNVGTEKTFNFYIKEDSLFISGPTEIIEANGENREEFRKMEEVRIRANSN